MQVLSIDYGRKKIGLAISDETKTIAAKLPVLKVKNKQEAIEGIIHILKSFPKVDKVVVGIPLGMDFKPTQMSVEIKNFIEKLKKHLDKKITVTFTNEIYSTKQAEFNKSKRFKKYKSDSESARIFLQEYLNHKNNKK